MKARPFQSSAAAQTIAACTLSLLVALGLLPSAAAVETTPPPAEGWAAIQPALRNSCYE